MATGAAGRIGLYRPAEPPCTSSSRSCSSRPWPRPPTGRTSSIADFEGDTYGDWKTTGTAFGKGPARGTLPEPDARHRLPGQGARQQLRSAATRAPARSRRRSSRSSASTSTSSIGGGKHAGKTCINLLVGGKAVRTATGPNDKPGGSEHLDWHTWDVAEFEGKKARRSRSWTRRRAAGATSTSITSCRATRRRRPSRRRREFDGREALPAPAGQERGPEAASDVRRRRARRSASSTSNWPTAKPDFWAFADVSAFKGKTLTVARRAAGRLEGPATRSSPADDVPDAEKLYRRSTARCSTSPAASGLAERPERAGLRRRGVAPVLPAQPVRLELGEHALGPRRQQGPGPLEGTGRSASTRRRYDDWAFSGSAVVDKDNTSGWGTEGEAAAGAGVHQHRPRRVHRLQHRQRPHLDRVRQEPGGQARRPRPEARLVRARRSTG